MAAGMLVERPGEITLPRMNLDVNSLKNEGIKLLGLVLANTYLN